MARIPDFRSSAASLTSQDVDVWHAWRYSTFSENKQKNNPPNTKQKTSSLDFNFIFVFWQSHFKLYFYHLKLRVLVSSIKNSTLCSPQCYCKFPTCCFHCPASSFLLNQKQNSFYPTFLHWNRLRVSMTSRFEFLFLWFPRISTFTCVYKLIWSSAYWLVKHLSASPLKWNLGIMLPLI